MKGERTGEENENAASITDFVACVVTFGLWRPALLQLILMDHNQLLTVKLGTGVVKAPALTYFEHNGHRSSQHLRLFWNQTRDIQIKDRTKYI